MLPRKTTTAIIVVSLVAAVRVDGAWVEGCPCVGQCSQLDFPVYLAEGDKRCWRVHYDEAGVEEAKGVCAGDGGSLAGYSGFLEGNSQLVSRDLWVDAKYDEALGWVWGDTNTSIPDSLWGAVPPQAGCAFLSHSDATLKLYPYPCTSQLSFLCTKPRVLYTSQVFTPSIASVTTPTGVTLLLNGTNLDSLDIRYQLTTSTCISATKGSASKTASPTASTWVIDTALASATTYTLCWGYGNVFSPTGVKVSVPGFPTMSQAALEVPVNSLGTNVAVTGKYFTTDLWVAPFSTDDCTGPASAPSTPLRPINATSAVFATPVGLPADGIPHTICIATSILSPLASLYRPTAATITVIPAPTVDAQSFSITYAQSHTPIKSLTITGSHMDQDNWGLAFFYQGGCIGAPVTDPINMTDCAAKSCTFSLHSTTPVGKVLRACLFMNNKYTSTGVTILVTPPPEFANTIIERSFSYAEEQGGVTIDIYARNLQTTGKSDPMLYPVFAPAAEGCASPNGIYGTFTAMTPINATVQVPQGLSGSIIVCVAASLSIPTSAGNWSAIFLTNVRLYIWPAPVFTPSPVLILPYSTKLSGTGVITVAGQYFSQRHLWISFSLTDSCASSVGTIIPMPAAANDTLEFSASMIFALANEMSTQPTSVYLCYAASISMPSSSSNSWVLAAGVSFKALPAPKTDAGSEEYVLTASEAKEGGLTLDIRGSYLQEGVLWGAFVTGDRPVGDLAGASCLAVRISCTGVGTGWCGTATVTTPPLTVEGTTYLVVWVISLDEPTTIPVSSVFSGYKINTLVPPSFHQSHYDISVGKWKAGFDLDVTGTNIGEGVWVWFQTESVCNVTGRHVIPLNGDKRSTTATIPVPAENSQFPTDSDVQLCYITSLSSDVYMLTGVTLKVAGLPVFKYTTIKPSLAELWDAETAYKTRLQGTNLVQDDIWTALCRADCSACTTPTLLADAYLRVPAVPSPTIDPQAGSTMCWATGVGSAPSLSQFVASSVRVVFPSQFVTADVTTVYPMLYREVQITAAQSGDSIPANTWASLCEDSVWVKVAADGTFTPDPFPGSNVTRKVCLTYSVSTPTDASASFSTNIQVSWAGVPALTSTKVTVPLSALQTGEVSLPLVGDNLGPAVYYKGISGDKSCSDVTEGGVLLVGSSYLLQVNFDEYPTTIRLCWAPQQVGVQRPVWAAGGDLGIVAVLQQKPVFNGVVVSKSMSDVLQGKLEIPLQGIRFVRPLYVSLQDGATDCSPNHRITTLALSIISQTTAYINLPAEPLLANPPMNGLVGLCWLTQDTDKNEYGNDMKATVQVAAMPTVVGTSRPTTLMQLVAGETQLPVTGDNLRGDTGLWVGCKTSIPPARVEGTPGNYTFDVPREVAGLGVASLPLCVAVSPEGSVKNISALVPVDGWVLQVHNLPQVEEYVGSARPGGMVDVRGTLLGASDNSPGTLLVFRPVGTPCPVSIVQDAVVATADVVKVPVPSLAVGTVLRLCMALTSFATFHEQPVTVTIGDTVAPATATRVPDTPTPTRIPTAEPSPFTPVPCPAMDAMAMQIRKNCYLNGLLDCLVSRPKQACGLEFVQCYIAVEGIHSSCYSDMVLGDPLTVTFAMEIASFDRNVFVAGLSASALTPPETIQILSVAPGSTHVTFVMPNSTYDAYEASIAANAPYFTSLGSDWVVVEATNAPQVGVTPVPGTAAPVPPVKTAGEGSGVNYMMIFALSGGALVVLAMIICLVVRVLKTDGEEAKEGDGFDGVVVRSESPQCVGPCGKPVAECRCSSGECGCSQCRLAESRTGTVKGQQVATITWSDEEGSEELNVQEIGSQQQIISKPPLSSKPSRSGTGCTSGNTGSMTAATGVTATTRSRVRRDWMPSKSPRYDDYDSQTTYTPTGGVARTWMVPASEASTPVNRCRNPLPPRSYQRSSSPVCVSCGNPWEGGRYCGYCGVYQESSPTDSASTFGRPPIP